MNSYFLVQSLTAVRIPLAVAFAITLPQTVADPSRLWLCLVLLGLQELSDVLDGWLARRLGVVSEWGKLFDPFADSTSRLIVYWSLAVAGRTFAVVPLVMAVRDITVAYSRLALTRQGGSVGARRSGKVKAWVQGLGAMFLLMAPLHLAWSGDASPQVASWVVLVVTASSAIEYVMATSPLQQRRRRRDRRPPADP